MTKVKLTDVNTTVSDIENLSGVLTSDDNQVIFLTVEGNLVGQDLQTSVTGVPTEGDFGVETFAVDETGRRYFNSITGGVIEV